MSDVISVFHGSEVLFVYGGLVNATASSAALSLNMVDYWVSFATCLDPNDGHGSLRALLFIRLQANAINLSMCTQVHAGLNIPRRTKLVFVLYNRHSVQLMGTIIGYTATERK